MAATGSERAGASMEERCEELGSTCRCSEPLNWDSGGRLPAQLEHDPADTEGPNAKECDGGAPIEQLSPFGEIYDTVPGSEVGLPAVSRVLEYTVVDGAASGNLVDTSYQDFSSSTWCQRIYFREDPRDAYPDVFGADDLKGTSNSKCDNGVNCPGISMNWRTGGLDMITFSSPWDFGTPASIEKSGEDVSHEECMNGWCRVELCADHNWDGTNRMRVRARLTEVSTKRQQEYGPRDSRNSLSSAATGQRTHIWRQHCDRGGSNDGACEGIRRWQSHMMTAVQSPADPNFWIGPAYELEGGGGGSNPTSPTGDLTRPGPPVLVE